MKNKFFILCFSLVGLACSYAFGLSDEKAEDNYKQFLLLPNLERIELHGDLLLSIGSDAIEAGFNDSAAYIQFNRNIGDVFIALYNDSGGLVYSGIVYTDAQQLVVIPLTNSSNGSYWLLIDNASSYLEGGFD